MYNYLIDIIAFERNEYRKLALRRKNQLKKDRYTFRGLFNRGYIYDDDASVGRGGKTRVQVDEERNNVPKETSINFENPSTSMITEAAKQGIDLKDPYVIRLLKQLQVEKLKTMKLDQIPEVRRFEKVKRLMKDEKSRFVMMTSIVIIIIAIATSLLHRKHKTLIMILVFVLTFINKL